MRSQCEEEEKRHSLTFLYGFTKIGVSAQTLKLALYAYGFSPSVTFASRNGAGDGGRKDNDTGEGGGGLRKEIVVVCDSFVAVISSDGSSIAGAAPTGSVAHCTNGLIAASLYVSGCAIPRLLLATAAALAAASAAMAAAIW